MRVWLGRTHSACVGSQACGIIFIVTPTQGGLEIIWSRYKIKPLEMPMTGQLLRAQRRCPDSAGKAEAGRENQGNKP